MEFASVKRWVFLGALISAVGFCRFGFGGSEAERFGQPLRVVIHVHSHVSGDKITLEELALLAQSRGIDAVILTDYFQQKVSWGIYPLHRLLRLWVERPSILRYGVSKYFQELEGVDRKIPEVLMIPGAEVTPFYWWSGSFWKGDWTVHDLQKNLLVFGLDQGSTDHLPTLENKGTLFDAYHGPRADKPYQAMIDYVEQHGGISIWSTPDEAFNTHLKVGWVQLSTTPYADSLLRTKGYTGVAIYPEGQTKTGIVGGGWDRLLMAYCRGKREKPVWAFAEGVIHSINYRQQLDVWDNIVFSAAKSERSVLEAMRRGRFYIREAKRSDIRLESFTVSDDSAASRAFLGEEVEILGNPKLRFRISMLPETLPETLILEVIRDGEVVHTEMAENQALESVWVDIAPLGTERKSYYRLRARTEPDAVGTLLSNPIFVRRRTEKVDSVPKIEPYS